MKIIETYRLFDKTTTSRYTFKSAGGTIKEIAKGLDKLKQDLFDAPQSLKKTYHKAILRIVRDTQKAITPSRTETWYRYKDEFTEKGTDFGPHLEHVIPFNEGMNRYLSGDIPVEHLLYHPTAQIHLIDSYKFKGTSWETKATWEFPFHRYLEVGITKEIVNCRGELVDPETYSIEDHFRLVGYADETV